MKSIMLALSAVTVLSVSPIGAASAWGRSEGVGQFYAVPVFEFSPDALKQNRQNVAGYVTVEKPLKATRECAAVEEAEKTYLGKDYKGNDLQAYKCSNSPMTSGELEDCAREDGWDECAVLDDKRQAMDCRIDPPGKKIVGVVVFKKDIKVETEYGHQIAMNGGSAGSVVCKLGEIKGVSPSSCSCKTPSHFF
jgi:hypothetical protein